MHSRCDMDDIARHTDTCGSTGVGAFVNASSLGAAGDVMQKWSVHNHLYMCVADPQQLPNSDTLLDKCPETNWPENICWKRLTAPVEAKPPYLVAAQMATPPSTFADPARFPGFWSGLPYSYCPILTDT